MRIEDTKRLREVIENTERLHCLVLNIADVIKSGDSGCNILSNEGFGTTNIERIAIERGFSHECFTLIRPVLVRLLEKTKQELADLHV